MGILIWCYHRPRACLLCTQQDHGAPIVLYKKVDFSLSDAGQFLDELGKKMVGRPDVRVGG
jgi:hypothetical protein